MRSVVLVRAPTASGKGKALSGADAVCGVANPVHTKKDDKMSSVLVYLFEGLSRFDGLEQEAIVECGPRATTRQESDAE